MTLYKESLLKTLKFINGRKDLMKMLLSYLNKIKKEDLINLYKKKKKKRKKNNRTNRMRLSK